MLEWPHQSVNDPSRVAYTQTARKGVDDIQTVMAAGKYFTRFWPHLTSNVIRDAVAGFIAEQEDSCKFLAATTEEIVRSVQEGPVSCMRWDEGEIADVGAHPYEAYAPELGWRAAVRMKGPNIVGRAMVHDGTNMRCGQKHTPSFVRSFKCADDVPHTTAYSYSDDKLEAWLRGQGVQKKHSWPVGTPFARVDSSARRYDFVLPYIDGERQCVSTESSKAFYTIDGTEYNVGEDGAFLCNETGGGYDIVDAGHSSNCDHCGDRTDEDDLTYVESRQAYVCDHCLECHFTHTDNSGWVHDDDVERSVEGVTWDSNGDTPEEMTYLDHGQYEGQYTHHDNTISDIHGAFWHELDVDSGVVQLCDKSVESGEYVPEDECVDVGGDYYLEDEDSAAGNITKITRGLSEGEWAVPDDVKIDIEGDKWRAEDEWVSALDGSKLSPFIPITPGRRGEFYVTLHDEADDAGASVCVSDALLVQGVGWFLNADLEAGTIAYLGDGLYALATEFALA